MIPLLLSKTFRCVLSVFQITAIGSLYLSLKSETKPLSEHLILAQIKVRSIQFINIDLKLFLNVL